MTAEPAGPAAALRWLTASLAQFVPGPPAIEARGLTKRCTELALTAAYLRSWVRDGSLPAEPFAAELEAWERALRCRCEDPEVLRTALRDPEAALFCAQPYLWMRASGYRLDAWEEALAQLSASGVRPASTGLVHCLWKAGLVRLEPDWDRALARWLSAWGERPAERNAYRVTHAAFYVTDFGNHQPPVSDGARDRLVDAARRLLERAAARRRWDLVAELLMALTYLRREDARHREAARALRRGWATAADAPDGGESGATPGSSSSSRSATGCDSREGDHDNFRRRYHTTLVEVLRHAATARSFASAGAGTGPGIGTDVVAFGIESGAPA